MDTKQPSAYSDTLKIDIDVEMFISVPGLKFSSQSPESYNKYFFEIIMLKTMIEVNYEKQRNVSQIHSYRKHCREFSLPTNLDCFSSISELITFLSSFQKKKRHSY